jgi:sugar phosphate isomerase/epimerase
MRLAISNIAWDITEDEAVAALLHDYQVDAIDIAPGKYFPDPANATLAEIARVKTGWSVRGIEITGMQALLFGTTGLNLFGPAEVQKAMLEHLSAVCRIGGALGAARLVFGSPKNRDRTGLSDAQTIDTAKAFLTQLGEVAAGEGVIICLEPNPECYGANFMTTSAETATVVRTVDHPAIRMQLDTGALTINGEEPVDVLLKDVGLVGHIHASEPNLVPLGDGGTDHAKMANAIFGALPGHLVSIEMLSPPGVPHALAVERALKVAVRHYRDREPNA